MEDLKKIAVSSLYGVGRVKAEAYARLGIENAYDLLTHLPRAYENRGNVMLLKDTRDDEKCSVILKVASVPEISRVRPDMSLLKFMAYDESGSCTVVFFNQNYLKNSFSPGAVFRFYGKVSEQSLSRSMAAPVFEPVTEGAELKSLYPIYPLTSGLTQKQVSKDIRIAMTMATKSLFDYLPDDIRVRNGLCTLLFALRNIHSPDDYRSLAIAKRRIMFDEFFMFALGIGTAKKTEKSKTAPVCGECDPSPLLDLLPYGLTNAQKRTVSEVLRDMRGEYPMRRIIVGDVGSGKTVCAAAAMYAAVKSGYQTALMAPTEILARQHYEDISPLFEKLGIKCELLIGAVKVKDKNRIYGMLAEDGRDRIDAVIGTHALISKGVRFSRLGLVVADEQHRFGVAQRAGLAEKSVGAHVLVMSATPIPRSLALVLYGDLDISKIDEMPPGRMKVDTFVVDESYRKRIEAFIDRLCGEGGQVYAVCPAIEESGEEEGDISLSDVSMIGSPIGKIKEKKPPLKAAEAYAGELAADLPNLNVGLIHGKLSSAEKERVMSEFVAGKIDVLVSTTVIEVGVNVPNACLMLVENAERFGLSQLHQLRGRVGRGKRKSYCVLVSDSKSPTARQRLNTMRNTYDGYAIAEADLAMRGPGDFIASPTVGMRQSGGVKFKLAGQCDDMSLMTSASKEAEDLLERDGDLSEHEELREEIDEMFRTDAEYIC